MRSPTLSTLLACTLGLTIFPTSARAFQTGQTPSAPPVSAAAAAAAAASSVGGTDAYANESFVITHSSWTYAMKADGTGYREQTVAVHLQSEAAVRNFGVLQIPFASSSERVELHYARARHTDGTLSETPASELIEQPDPVTVQAPFYSDLKSAQLPIKNLRIGDTIEWQVRVLRTRAEAPNHFWGEQWMLTQGYVVLGQDIELRYPAGQNATVWTNPRLKVTPVITTEGDEKVYRWHSQQLKPTVGEAAQAEQKEKQGKPLSEEEETDYEQGALPSVAWTNFQSWADLGTWYQSLSQGRATPDDEIAAKVAELTKGKTTEEEKARALYSFVATQLRYIGVAFGVGRFQPHQAVDVLHNQYGDCKDKATLLIAMMQAAGLKADSVLVGAGLRFNDAVPSPSAFNHMISRVLVDNKEIWLDPTTEVAPYRVLVPTVRDKQVLVVPAHGLAVLDRTPKDLPFPALDTWRSVGSLNEKGALSAHIVMTEHSDTETQLRMAAHSIPPARYDDFVQQFVKGMGFPGTTSHAVLSRPEDTDKPFSLEFDYKEDDPTDNADRFIANFAPDGLPIVDKKNPPTTAIQLGSPAVSDSTSEIKLPAGWGAQLPESVHEKADWASADVTYKLDNGVVHASRRIEILQSKIPASQWQEYSKWATHADIGMNLYLYLLRPGKDGKPVSSGGAAGHVTTDEVQAQIAKADEAIGQMNATEATRILDQVKATDDKAYGLWLDYGRVASLQGKNSESIEDYRKELQLYPRHYWAYWAIAQAYWQRKQYSEAEAITAQWIAADPDNPGAYSFQSALFSEEKKFAEAGKASQKAIALTPAEDTEHLEMRRTQLGTAQMKAGDLDGGEASLVEVLKTTDEAGYLNDAAYGLADAKRQLPLAEEKVRLALHKLDTETQSWTLQESPERLKARTRLLFATWDTFGWILYRNGKPADALPYVYASYINEHHDEVLGHLNEIDDALKRPRVSSDKKSRQEDLTFELGPYSGPKIAAPYRLLLGHGKVEVDQPVGSDSIGGADGMLKAASFDRLFPPDSEAKIVVEGTVKCGSGSCQILLHP
ncbi:MAG: DUF3857 domain-containing protein [Acidobacteriaceae bacterium]|nr:DUF3857 domain-containing protein [Acidobacteriaceae bacterium]